MLRLCRTVFCLGLISGMMPVLWADPEDKPCPSMTCKIEVNECEWDTFFEAEEDMGISSPVGRPAELLAWLPAVQTPEPVPPVPVVRREGRVPRDRDENGDDRRGGPPEGRRDGFGNNSQPQVSEEKLMEFLEKHEPKLAERLKGLKESEPWQYRRQMGALGRLYGAVISQMERDPEMGELELKRIRLQLKIKDRQRDYRRADNDDEKKKAKGELKKYVAELFDVILDQENHRYERFAEHLKDFHSSGSQPDQGRSNQPGPGPGPGDRPGPPRGEGVDRGDGPPDGASGRGGDGFGRRWRPSPEQRQKYLEDYKETIESWKKQRDKIIDHYVSELLAEERPFPWPR